MGTALAPWMPDPVGGAKQVVLLVLDGLGWEQLTSHTEMIPTLTEFEGGPITAVAPTTTVSCLTSVTTGRPPASHGVLGYRMAVENDVLDVLKWRNSRGDALDAIVPESFQTQPAFAANAVPVVTRNHFSGTGFTRMHLQGAKLHGYSAPSSLPLEVWKLADAGERLIYAYYEGIDAIAHANGFGQHYDAELYTADRLIRDLLAGLPKGTALVVTADHGQVEVGNRVLDLGPEIKSLCHAYSGEGRFRWLHSKNVTELVRVANESCSELAWVLTRDEMIEAGWFGGPVSDKYLSRLGDVAIVPFEPVAFRDPTHDGEHQMVCRHGSLTSAEMLVPLLARRV